MRYSLTMINANGYEIKREFKTISACKHFANWYPLSAFFAWIYDKTNDEMLYQNNYSNTFFKCNNTSFVPYCC